MFPVTVSRRPHRKTKTGCAVCKRRKVKCDETRPSCKNCINYGEACVYVPIRPRKAPSSSSTGSALQTAHSNTESPQSTHSEIGTSISNFSQSNNQNNCQNRLSNETDLNLRDLELLHNFYTSTYATIHHDRALQTLWRTNVAHLGISHPFVMHAILAFSALHLAHFTPTADKRHFYIQQAMAHHEKGLQIATSAMFVLTKESCTPLFLFSVLTCIFALARPRRPDDFILVGETGLSEWLLILRGSGSIIDFAEPQLRAGPLGPLFNAGTRRNTYRNTLSLETESIEAFSYLKELSDRISTSPLSFHEREIYRLSLEEIRSPLAVIYGQEVGTFESGDVFVWVLKVPKEFLLLLKEHTQEALAIFSLFAVIIKPLGTNWWIEGLSHHLISRIYELVDAEHKDWIQWPIHQLGWIPPDLEPGSHGHAHAHSHGSTSGRFDGHGSLASRVNSHSHSHSQDTRDGMGISHDGYTPESNGYTSGVGRGGVGGGGSVGGSVGGSGSGGRIQPQVDSRSIYDPRLQNCEPGRTEYLDKRNNRDRYEGHGGSVIR